MATLPDEQRTIQIGGPGDGAEIDIIAVARRLFVFSAGGARDDEAFERELEALMERHRVDYVQASWRRFG